MRKSIKRPYSIRNNGGTFSDVYQRLAVTYSIASWDYQRRILERQIGQAQKTIDRNKEKVPICAGFN